MAYYFLWKKAEARRLLDLKLVRVRVFGFRIPKIRLPRMPTVRFTITFHLAKILRDRVILFKIKASYS